MTAPARRFDVDSDDLARGFSQIVLAVAEVLRELLERQVLRRIDAGDLTPAQIESLGTALMRISEELDDLRANLARPRTDNTERHVR